MSVVKSVYLSHAKTEEAFVERELLSLKLKISLE